MQGEETNPKPPRRVKTPAVEHLPTRQVHFQTTTAGETARNTERILGTDKGKGKPPQASAQNQSQTQTPSQAVNSAAPATTSTISSQPSSFPALVPPPGLSSGQWFTGTADQCSTSVQPTPQLPTGLPQLQSQYPHPGLIPPRTPAHLFPPHQQQSLHFSQPHSVAYIYNAQPQIVPTLSKPNIAMAADYQNAAPLPTGLNYQPPVPDTSMGPMNHVYIPRFDGGVQQAAALPVQVGYPIFYQNAPYSATTTATATPYYTNVTVLPPPKPYYTYQYYYQQPGVHGVPVQQPGYVMQPQPAYVQQQPVMIGGQPTVLAPGQPIQAPQAAAFIPGAPTVIGGGQHPVIAGNIGPFPEVAGLGRTQGEETLRQISFAHANRLFEAQDFKPADDDPSRFYYVRELDGNWTQRNRFSIDHMGDCRWYVTDEGWFYAVRLPN